MSKSLDTPGKLSALEQYSFSDEAGQLVIQQHPQLTPVYHSNIAGVWRSILGEESFGMIPFENSSGGVVWPHLERLMQENQPLQIAAAVRLKVKMCAGGKSGMDMQNVRRVYSHSKALDQSSQFIGQLSPDIQTVECPSTVDGAVRAAAANELPSIALASRSALEAHGLEIFADDIANLPGAKNVTKFFVVHRNGEEALPRTDAKYHAAIITPHEARGVLADILQEIRNRQVNLISLHSRSVGDHEYAFYLEMERQGSQRHMRRLKETLEESMFVKSVKWLGSWDEQLEN